MATDKASANDTSAEKPSADNTTDSATNPGNPPEPAPLTPKAEPQRTSRWRSGLVWTRDAAFDAGRASAPTVKRVGARLGDWLATVGWGKFFLVALLLIIVGAIADNVLYNTDPVVVVKMGDREDRVQVNLQVAPDGMRAVLQFVSKGNCHLAVRNLDSRRGH
jgi:hypothetical protein